VIKIVTKSSNWQICENCKVYMY